MLVSFCARWWWGALRDRLALWRSRRRGRAELARLGDVELGDIGVTPSEAWYEARKPFWRP